MLSVSYSEPFTTCRFLSPLATSLRLPQKTVPRFHHSWRTERWASIVLRTLLPRQKQSPRQSAAVIGYRKHQVSTSQEILKYQFHTNLGENNIGELFRHALVDGSNHFARRAPGCSEVRHDKLILSCVFQQLYELNLVSYFRNWFGCTSPHFGDLLNGTPKCDGTSLGSACRDITISTREDSKASRKCKRVYTSN